ncbi:MAG: PD-(D/E)XK nuclease family protein [Paludibacter sp.]|jgi:hypothetical protein
MNNIADYSKLIEEFKQIPKFEYHTTYLNICRYPGNRFEEICSRILAFFFQPNNEHGLKDLFLQSLFDTINKENPQYVRDTQITVDTEVQSEDNKRLDILITGTDFIIGIENKIYASLYNPLDSYKETINKKANQCKINKDKIFKIVLSVKKITDQSELTKMNDNGFVKVYYSEFFENLKKNVGNYFSQANPKYVTIMYDFIETIENMDGKIDDKMIGFFIENKDNVKEMIDQYKKVEQQIQSIQINRISEILYKIKERIDENWSDWNWLLVIDKFNANTELPRIGIESCYSSYNRNPLGKFIIYITTWSVKDYEPYEEILKIRYPDRIPEKNPYGDNKVYLYVDEIYGDDETEILKKLKYHYDELKSVVAELLNKK